MLSYFFRILASATSMAHPLEKKAIFGHSSTEEFLTLVRHKTGYTEPTWMDWDSDRGEDVPGSGIMAARCVEFKVESATFGEHADNVIDYAKDLQLFFGDAKLYFRMSGCWHMFVLTEQKHKDKVLKFEEDGEVARFNKLEKHARIVKM